jgi:hypothetical protein
MCVYYIYIEILYEYIKKIYSHTVTKRKSVCMNWELKGEGCSSKGEIEIGSCSSPQQLNIVELGDNTWSSQPAIGMWTHGLSIVYPW